MLKYVTYHRTLNNEFPQVAYVIFGKNCVFTACQSAGFGSSINFAEKVAQRIAEKEKRRIKRLRWFDLQTRFSYGKCGHHFENPSDYDFDEVVFSENKATSWRPTICPDHVVEMFWPDYIDGEPNQVFPGGREEAQQVHFPQPR